MTEPAVAIAPEVPKVSKKRGPKPGGPKKERKPRASTVAVGFAQKVEQAAANKIAEAATELAEVIEQQSKAFAEKLVGEDWTEGASVALLTVAIGKVVGVSKIGVAAAQNALQPAIAEAMLAKIGV